MNIAPREAHPVSLEQETKTVIEEARMVLPGIQALFGFQLMAVLNNDFNSLKPPEQILHLSALILVVIATTVFGRAAQPAEIAPIFVFLASGQSSYVTGEIYGAAGGQMPM
jgi:NAD(P)-dependent dehydrogenase (short-subunit alcohol dehydrogenase family)